MPDSSTCCRLNTDHKDVALVTEFKPHLHKNDVADGLNHQSVFAACCQKRFAKNCLTSTISSKIEARELFPNGGNGTSSTVVDYQSHLTHFHQMTRPRQRSMQGKWNGTNIIHQPIGLTVSGEARRPLCGSPRTELPREKETAHSRSAPRVTLFS